MKAMILEKTVDLKQTRTPLTLTDFPEPVPEKKDILIQSDRLRGLSHRT